MSDSRPTVSPNLVAQIIEATPDRVRRRLDRTPNAAAEWTWQSVDEGWSIDTGGEVVTIAADSITSLNDIQCSCLLSPNCFHVLACLTVLEVALTEAPTEGESADAGDEAPVVEEAAPHNLIPPNEKQVSAAGEMADCMDQLLKVGVANAGVVVQSRLLRAVHQCRSDGLYRVAAVGLRVLAGIAQHRNRAAESDPAQLAEDVADVIETTHRITNHDAVESFWIGTARRQQFPVRPRKLHGLFAEPVLTRSGYAGAAAYFLGEDDQIYTASDVRPGDAQLARDAYLGGIEIGPLTQPARQLARGLYLGSDLTASLDGRLGRGKKIKFVQQGDSSWESDAVERRFAVPLADQWKAIYARAADPADARPAGWDFVFVAGKVIGASGPELLLGLGDESLALRLAIANEEPELTFRENLRMLSHAPGLPLRVIGRVELTDPTVIHALAVSPCADDVNQDQPQLEIPSALANRVCLGFDEIRSKWLLNAQLGPVDLGASASAVDNDPLAVLRRRWTAMLLSGASLQRSATSNTILSETAMLNRIGYGTAASLLDAISRRERQPSPMATLFLAVALYLRKARYELAQSRALMQN